MNSFSASPVTDIALATVTSISFLLHLPSWGMMVRFDYQSLFLFSFSQPWFWLSGSNWIAQAKHSCPLALARWLWLSSSGSVALAQWLRLSGSGSVALAHWLWLIGTCSLALAHWLWLAGSGSLALAHQPHSWLVASSILPWSDRNRFMNRITNKALHTVQMSGSWSTSSFSVSPREHSISRYVFTDVEHYARIVHLIVI